MIRHRHRHFSRHFSHLPAGSKPWRSWLPSLFTNLGIVGLLGLQLLQPLEAITYQWLFQMRGPLTWDDRVVLIKIDEPSIQKLGKFPWSRDRYTQLLNILETAKPNTVIFDLVFADTSTADPQLATVMAQHKQVIVASAGPNHAILGQPTPLLAQSAMAIGHILYQPDRDGIVRQVPAYMANYPTLSLPSVQSYRLFAQAPPPPPHSSLWINWIGNNQTLPQYAFSDVLNGQVAPEQFRQKIIVVGVTAPGLNPLITPFHQSPPSSGVHLHLTLMNNLLQQNLLRPLHGELWLLLLLLSNLLWNGLFRRLSFAKQLFSSGLLTSGWVSLSLLALHFNYWLPVISPLVLWLSMAIVYWISRSLKLEAKNQQLQYLVNIDELTQIPNRRAFEQSLRQEWQRSLREQQPLSLLLCDIDFFKQFNDYYGHLAGDDCLYQVAQALRHSSQRPSDVIARYGGEEFAILLPNTDIQGARNISHRMLGQVRSLLIPHQASAISHYLTISIGSVSVIPHPHVGWSECLDIADRALYRAKAAGRDQSQHAQWSAPSRQTAP